MNHNAIIPPIEKSRKKQGRQKAEGVRQKQRGRQPPRDSWWGFLDSWDSCGTPKRIPPTEPQPKPPNGTPKPNPKRNQAEPGR